MLEQLQKFNDIVFEPIAHTYHLDDVQFTSATTWLHQFQEAFDADAISLRMAKGNKQAALELQRQWKVKSNAACSRGTHLHEYLECKIAGVDVALHDDAIDLYPVADRFIAETAGKIDFSMCEFRTYNEAWKICGTVDLLVWNKRYQQYEIWDYKTNKSIDMKSNYNKKLKAPFNQFDDCNFIMYSLQLSLYRLMIELNTDIKIGTCRLVHIAPDNYHMFTCLDLRKNILVEICSS